MADLGKKSRKSNFSQEEVDILVKTVGKNYDVLYGEYSKRAIYKDVRHQAWLDVTHEVNQVSMEKRTLQEVKNKWKKCQHLYRGEDLLDISDEFDSMPLEQRLKSPVLPSTSEQEQVLHSHPLTPTKLKVTRQTKLKELSPKPPTPPPPIEEICLKWNSHHGNMQSMFPALLLKEQYVDATLVAEGQNLKCHRIILSSCSPYFEEVLSSISPYQHPVLFMKDMPFWILKSLCDFMYSGEVLIPQDKLNELLLAAENLKIKGLAGAPDLPNEDLQKDSLIKHIKEEQKEEQVVEKEPERKENTRDKKRFHQSSTANPVVVPTEIPAPKNSKLPKTNTYTEPLPGKMSKISKPNPYSDPSLLRSSTKPSRASVSYIEPPPVKTSLTKVLRSSSVQKKIEKSDKVVIKEPISKGDILDPFDLLEPVYEEVQKEPKPPGIQNKIKETSKAIPVRKTVQKKIKKRKITDDRDESPPPVLSRKGTRSRPNKKIPRFYHSGFDNSTPKIQESPETTIVREPHTSQVESPALSSHTDQPEPEPEPDSHQSDHESHQADSTEFHEDPSDPLFQLENIKAEPFDVEDSTIEIEDNLVNFSEPETSMTEEELLEETFEPPVLSYEEKTETEKPAEEKPFKKIRVMRQQVLLDVEKASMVKIVDVDKIKVSADTLEEDPLNLNTNLDSSIKIMNVESLIEIKEPTSETSKVGFKLCDVPEMKETQAGPMEIQIASVLSEGEEEKLLCETETTVPVCQIAEVFSETECETNKDKVSETEECDKTVPEEISSDPKNCLESIKETTGSSDTEQNKQSQAEFVGFKVSNRSEELDDKPEKLEGIADNVVKNDEKSDEDVINELENNSDCSAANQNVIESNQKENISTVTNIAEIVGCKTNDLEQTVAAEQSLQDLNKTTDHTKEACVEDIIDNSVQSYENSESIVDDDNPEVIKITDFLSNSNDPSSTGKDVHISNTDTDPIPLHEPEDAQNTDIIDIVAERSQSDPEFELKTDNRCLEETFDQDIVTSNEPSDMPTNETRTKDPVLANTIPYTNEDLSMPSQNEDLSMTSQPEELQMEVCDEVFSQTASFDQPSNSFELADVVQNEVSGYSTPGFHIAQVISEQIALNEECRMTNQPMDTTDPCFEGGSNELEMIVNDLTKIVGETQRLETNMEHEDIAESLENLLEK